MKPGTCLQAPDGRRYKLRQETGLDGQQVPVVKLHRLDRQPREALVLWRPVAVVETWEVIHG